MLIFIMLFGPLLTVIIYYKFAVRIWFIEGLIAKVILVIAVYGCGWIGVISFFQSIKLAFLIGLKETGGVFLFAGSIALIATWMLVAVVAKKIARHLCTSP
ncbi:membrane hypothetical protein [Crenothrix polyspora]|uniref:Uncharacterized protein n=1 Tax=Crenothrix polyspora TaxID=360316 RepID=A0A1R4HE09_9GAMM|nr:hypothetical protein [Crenothrix polyspora]SJM94449.1 membrane hypothetical protein [Crenothrix polyspora]